MHRLSCLRLEGIGTGITLRGGARIREYFQNPNLSIELDEDMSYEMLRSQSDLWTIDDDQREARAEAILAIMRMRDSLDNADIEAIKEVTGEVSTLTKRLLASRSSNVPIERSLGNTHDGHGDSNRARLE